MTTIFYKGRNSQKQSFEANLNATFHIAQDFQYSGKSSKHYASYTTIDDFLNEEHTLDSNCYETLKDERVTIFDVDGYYTNPIFQNGEGKPASTSEIVTEFIDAYTDFHEETYPDLPVPKKTHFLIKKTDDPKNEKESLHFIIRNGYKFKDHKHHKAHASAFKKYCQDIYKVDIDMSIYSANRLIRILGHHKLNQPDRYSYRYPDHTKYNLQCDVKQFFASYLNGDEIEYPSQRVNGGKEGDTLREEENFDDFLSSFEEDTNTSDETVETLLELILETVDTETSPLCDEEIKNKLNYNSWYKLVLTVFNCMSGGGRDEFNCRYLYEKLFDYYRHKDGIDKDKYFDDLYRRKGEYKELTVNSLHYLARYNKKYEEQFKEEILRFKEKVKLLRYERDLRRAKKLELENEPIIDYIHQIKALCKQSRNTSFTRTHIEKTLHKIIVNVSNGGKSMVFPKSSYYDENSMKNIEKYTPCKLKQLADFGGACQVKIRHINTDYKEEVAIYNSLTDKAKAKVSEPQQYIFKYIAHTHTVKGGILNDMYINSDIDNKNNVCFVPYLKRDKNKAERNYKDCLNLFTGFAYDDESESRDDPRREDESRGDPSDNLLPPSGWLCSRTRYNLKNYLCAGNEEFFNYFERYIAHILQYPKEIPGIMIIFSGAQGTGKDLLVEFLANMIGNNLYLGIGKMADLFSNFNSNHQGKLLVRINEISDKGIQFEKHDELKNLITATKVRIESKGIDAYEHEHLARYIGFSNKANIIQLENSDRRMAMITTDDSMSSPSPDNRDYFLKILEEKKDPLMLSDAFSYFANLPLDDFNIRNIPHTDYRATQKITSLPTSLKFMLEIFEEIKSDEIKIHLSDLYPNYLSWCISDGITKHCIRKTFASDIEKLGLECKRLRINNRQALGYSFTHTEVQELFRKYLRNEKFELQKYEA